jgi:hypothetical protein
MSNGTRSKKLFIRILEEWNKTERSIRKLLQNRNIYSNETIAVSIHAYHQQVNIVLKVFRHIHTYSALHDYECKKKKSQTNETRPEKNHEKF